MPRLDGLGGYYQIFGIFVKRLVWVGSVVHNFMDHLRLLLKVDVKVVASHANDFERILSWPRRAALYSENLSNVLGNLSSLQSLLALCWATDV